MIQVNIKVDDNVTPKLRRLSPQLRNRTGQKLVDVASFIQNRAIQYAYENAPYSRTGNLAKSIIVTNVNTIQGRAEIKADRRIAPYAPFVEEGTKQHPVPRNPLRHTWRTAPEHPGTQGKHFMFRAAVDARLIAPKKIVEGIRLAVRDVGLRAG